MINPKIRGRPFFRSAFYFPSLVSSAAIAAIAIYILNANGLLNAIIGGNQAWFGDPSTALWSIMGLNAWTTAGTVMLFYLAALQSISTDVYEAAAIDGTSTWRTFWRITFPLLKPAHFFVLVVFGIGALKVFDQAFIVSGGTGGPELLDVHGRPLHLQRGLQDREFRGRSGGGGRPLRRHLPARRHPAGDGRPHGGGVMLQTSASAADPYVPPRARSAIVGKIVLYGLLAAIALLYFTPFVWSLSTSFKTLPDTANFNFIPHPFTTAAWKSVWTDYDFKRYALNSLFLAVVITALNLFLAALGGYAFARLRFPGREILFLLVLGTLMIPDQLRLIPVFVMLTDWHLIGNFSGYILISLVSAVNLFFMRQYFLTIPKDFEEAAKLDGAGFFKTFWRVMLPLAAPAIAALAILQFQGTWNDFFWPLILFGQGNEDHVHDAARARAVHVHVPDAVAPADGRGASSRSCRSSSSSSSSSATSSPGSRPRGSRDEAEGRHVLALRDFYANSWRLVARQRRARRRPRREHPRTLAPAGRGRAPRRRGPCGRRHRPLRSDARANRGSRVRRRLGGTAPALAAWPRPLRPVGCALLGLVL